MTLEVATVNSKSEYDDEIRGCIKRNSMEGLISVSFETEPSYFDSISVQGNVEVIAATENTKVVGVGTRAVKSIYVNGNAQSVGYVGGFRIDKAHRNGLVFLHGLKIMKQLHKNDPQEFYLGSIMEDNKLAREVLTKSRKGLPETHHLFDMVVYTIRPSKRSTNNNNIKILSGDSLSLEKIIEFINIHGSKKQFFPHITTEDFDREITRGLKQKDLLVGVDDNENILSVIAKWDQSGFKQTRVVSYKQPLKLLRPIVNLFSSVTGNPVLPKEGRTLHSFYSSFNVVKNNDPLIYEQMLNKLSSSNIGYSYFNIGLAKQDPLNQAIKVPCRKNIFKIYGFTFENNNKIFTDLKNQIPYLESAML